MTFPGAAGNIRSTTEDLCRWHLALFGGRIVSPESLAAMIKPGRLNNGALPLAAMKPGPKTPLKYGFGLQTDDFDGHVMIGHNGGINGFITTLHSFPKEGVTVAILINGDPSGRPTFMPRMQAIQDAAARTALI